MSCQCGAFLSTGAKGTEGTVGGTGSHARSYIEALGNDWYRCVVVGSIGGGVTTARLICYLATTDASVTYNGDGASYVILWGGQGEVNVPFASSYIETAGSPVIRATESMTFPFDVGMQEATFYARFRERGAIIADSGLRLMQIAASNPSLHIRAETGWRVRHTDGAAASVESTSAALPAINDVVELRAVLNADGSVQMHQSINSGTEASGSASAAQALATDKKWGSAILSVSLVGTPGYFNLIDLMSVAGVHSLGDCRKATQQ